MTTSKVSLTEGSGKNAATYSFSEDAVTKEAQRVALNESDGSDTAIAAKLGALTETAPASDTASSGLNGRLQRIAQRITSLIALVPASLGGKAAASSFAVTTATDDPPLALLGAVGETAPATDTASSGLNGRLQRIAQRITSLFALLPTALGANGGLKIEGVASGTTVPVTILSTQVASVLDCSTTITRPADTNAYTANDAFANSTSAPTAGGFTLTSAAAVSGGGGVITDVTIVASGATLYQGEIWVFDSAVSAVPNDNAAFACADADHLLLLGKIPFTLVADVSTTSWAHVTGLNIGFHCVGTANLRFLVRITNAPTPTSAETLTVRIKGVRS